MPTYKDVLSELETLADPGAIKNKSARFGISPEQSLGIYQADLNRIAKRIGYDNELAEQLFDSGIYDAKLLCSKLYDPALVTEAKMDTWVRQFDTWEICDSFCSRVFARSRHAIPKALEWSARDPEFEKRAGFATMAHYVFADKQAEDAVFEQFFPSIVNGASDDRKYVKKAVSWALRQIGKRNSKLNKMAIDLAIEIGEQSNRSAQWVANDVLRELQNGKANILGYPRS